MTQWKVVLLFQIDSEIECLRLKVSEQDRLITVNKQDLCRLSRENYNLKSHISELEAQMIRDPSSTENKLYEFHQKVHDRKSCENFNSQLEICNKSTTYLHPNSKMITDYSDKDSYTNIDVIDRESGLHITHINDYLSDVVIDSNIPNVVIGRLSDGPTAQQNEVINSSPLDSPIFPPEVESNSWVKRK